MALVWMDHGDRPHLCCLKAFLSASCSCVWCNHCPAISCSCCRRQREEFRTDRGSEGPKACPCGGEESPGVGERRAHGKDAEDLACQNAMNGSSMGLTQHRIHALWIASAADIRMLCLRRHALCSTISSITLAARHEWHAQP